MDTPPKRLLVISLGVLIAVGVEIVKPVSRLSDYPPQKWGVNCPRDRELKSKSKQDFERIGDRRNHAMASVMANSADSGCVAVLGRPGTKPIVDNSIPNVSGAVAKASFSTKLYKPA